MSAEHSRPDQPRLEAFFPHMVELSPQVGDNGPDRIALNSEQEEIRNLVIGQRANVFYTGAAGMTCIFTLPTSADYEHRYRQITLLEEHHQWTAEEIP